MSHKIYSLKQRSQQDLQQWCGRTITGELQSCHNRTITKIFDDCFKNSSIKILEAGCGLGGWVHYFRQKGYDIIGIEHEREIVEKVKEYDPFFPIILCDVRKLEYPDNTFDAYLSLGVIEHFEKGPYNVLEEAKRVLKSKGLIFVTVPYLNLFRKIFVHPLRKTYFMINKVNRNKEYFREYRYNKQDLIHLFEETGFEIIKMDVDDYLPEDSRHHIGLYTDFFLFRKRKGEIWELNFPGKIILKILRLFSPWFFCSGILIVGKKQQITRRFLEAKI